MVHIRSTQAKGEVLMAMYELRYKRWLQGAKQRGKRGFAHVIEADDAESAYKAAQEKWDNLMRYPSYLHPEFVSFSLVLDWKPKDGA